MKTVQAVNFHDFSTSITGKASKINGYRIVPVILAMEMIQDYGVWELPEFLRKQLNLDLDDKVSVFKSYDTLKDSIKGVKQLPISFGHNGMISKGDDWLIEGWVYKLVADEERKLIRGTARISTLHLTDEQIFLLDQGSPINVSIGGTAIFGDGCNFCIPPYRFEQEKILLNHLAILWDEEGRCGIDSCGLNMDSAEGNKKPQTGIHVCGFNDTVLQPVFKLQTDVLNTVNSNNIINTLKKREINMPNELEIKLALLNKEMSDLRTSNSEEKAKLTIERDTALNDAKNKCGTNKKLLETIKDQKLKLKEYDTKEKESYVKFFEDRKLMTKEEVMALTSGELEKRKEWAEKLITSINDKSIQDNGLPKPEFQDRGDPDAKRDLEVSSIPALNKKKEEDDK